MRWLWTLVAVGAAFVAGGGLAGGAPREENVGERLARRQKLLLKDLERVQQAAKDVVELREVRESGKYILNDEERKLERTARMDMHIYMERARNDTLETLEILDRLLETDHYVEPLRRVFGSALDEIVRVRWEEQELDAVVGELAAAYGVQIHVGGEINYRKLLSLQGDMSLLSILLYLENLYDAKIVVKDDKVWMVRVGGKKDDAEEKEE